MVRGSLQTNCDECGTDVRKFKHLKKCNSGFLCGKCVSKRRLKHREFLKREILGLTKEQEKREIADEKNYNDRERRKKLKARQNKILLSSIKPTIKSIRREGRPRLSYLGIYLIKLEKYILYKKLVHSGLDSEEAKIRIDNLSKQMQMVLENLKKIVKTKEELNIRFKEEFAKLLEREE